MHTQLQGDWIASVATWFCKSFNPIATIVQIETKVWWCASGKLKNYMHWLFICVICVSISNSGSYYRNRVIGIVFLESHLAAVILGRAKETVVHIQLSLADGQRGPISFGRRHITYETEHRRPNNIRMRSSAMRKNPTCCWMNVISVYLGFRQRSTYAVGYQFETKRGLTFILHNILSWII